MSEAEPVISYKRVKAMSQLQVNQVKSKLHLQFDGLIDMSDKNHLNKENFEAAFLARALAARALNIYTGSSDQESADAVTDGTKDNGIDALLIDTSASSPTLTLVQSKWRASGTGSISVGDTLKFIVGLKDLTDCNFDMFNSKIKNQASALEAVLDDPTLTVKLLVATTGIDDLAADCLRHLQEAASELNALQEMLTFEHLKLNHFHKAILGGLDPGVPELSVLLREWGRIGEPYEAYTGLISVSEVASWYQTHGERLFVKNIRKSLGNTVVNSSISQTLRDEPANFWYYNNGITVLCESIAKTVRHGATKNAGTFVARGVSIVNGAQTVASIARAVRDMGADVEIDASVTVRFISLENCPPSFADDVTRATNTQNTVEAQDFVALDPQQVRLRQELALTLSKVYSIKRGEQAISAATGCTVNEATIALACFESDASLAVLAKSAIGRLYASTTRGPYRRLFNSGTSVFRLWRAVEVMRAVDAALAVERRSLDGRDDAVALQGNRIILHLVARQLPVDQISSPDFDWSSVLTKIPAITKSVLHDLTSHVNQHYAGNYITSLFKNAARCAKIVDSLVK